MLQGPPIQVVGVALITEFCDHNYSFVEVIIFSNLNQTFTKKVWYNILKVERKHTQGFSIKPDYWRGQPPLLKYWGEGGASGPPGPPGSYSTVKPMI